MKNLVLLFTFIIICKFAIANIEQDHNIDFQKLVLELNFNVKEEKVIGVANYSFIPYRKEISKIVLNAKDLNIKSVSLEDKNIAFEISNDKLIINLESALPWNFIYDLKISYTSQAKEGLYFIGWADESKRAKKQIWSQYTKNGSWFPSFWSKSDKLITETIVTFDNDFEVISNGKLLSKKQKGNSNIWHYAMQKPHSLYLLMVAIGEYDFKEFQSSAGVTTIQYYYPEDKNAIETTYKFTNRMMKWFYDELGAYPWSGYRNIPIRDFMYGAMENTTSTVFSDVFLNPKPSDRNYLALNAHSLAHQWFGNSLTSWKGDSHWIQEGLATNYSKHFIRKIDGEDEYKQICREEQNVILEAEKNNNYPVAYKNAGAARHYEKASYIIDMLRYIVGEDEFKKTIKQFVEDNQYKNVDSHDFQKAFMKTLGLDLEWFFDQWVYSGGIPKYKVSYKKKLNRTVFIVSQTQKNENVGLFKMPIVFQVHYKDGTFDEVTKWIKKTKQSVVVPNKQMKKVLFVLFDPKSKILKELIFDKDFEELTWQASKAKNMLDRLDAVNGMKSIEIAKKRDLLIEIYLEEKNIAIKKAVLSQLKNDVNITSIQLFVYAIAEDDIRLKKHAVENLNLKSKRYLKFYEEMLQDENAEIVEKALLKLYKFYPAMLQEYLNRTRGFANNNDNFRITWLKLKYKNQKTMYSEIVDYTSNSYNFLTRKKAIYTLGEINYYDKYYMRHLVDAFLSHNHTLKFEAEKQLNIFLKDAKVGAIVANYISNHKWLAKDEKILDELLIKNKRKIYK